MGHSQRWDAFVVLGGPSSAARGRRGALEGRTETRHGVEESGRDGISMLLPTPSGLLSDHCKNSCC